MRLSLSDDEIAQLDLALQDREAALKRYGGCGPLVRAQLAECMALRTKLQGKPAKPKRKPRTQRATIQPIAP